MSLAKPTVRIATEEWLPWIKLKDYGNGTIIMNGPMKSVLDIYADVMDFNYELLRPADGQWGVVLPNGSWTGMLGMINRTEVEFAIAPFFVTPGRAAMADYTQPIHIDNEAIMMVRPTIESDMGGFLKPFTALVWLSILASVVTVGFTMSCLVWAEGKIFNTPHQNHISKAALWVVQTVSQESSHWLPKKDGGRLIVITWLLASLVFMSSYSGILTAMLTVPRVTIPIDSLEDLVSQKKLPWRLQHGSMIYQMFRDSQDELHRKAFTERQGTVPDCWVSREKVAQGEFAVPCDATTIRMAMSWDFSMNGRCNLYKSRKRVYDNGLLSLMFKTNSTYLPDADKIIVRLRESGIVDKLLKEQMPNATNCLRPPTTDKREGILALNLTAFFGPFLFLIAGFALSLMTLMTELLVSSAKPPYHHPNRSLSG